MSKRAETPGEMAKAALEREAHLAAPKVARAPVGVPLLVEPAANGLARLVHVETGQVVGQCVNEQLANSTKNFLQ